MGLLENSSVFFDDFLHSWWFNGGLLGFNGGLMAVTRPGKRLHNELERSTMLSMGKSTISMAIFSSYFDITRGYSPASIDIPNSLWIYRTVSIKIPKRMLHLSPLFCIDDP